MKTCPKAFLAILAIRGSDHPSKIFLVYAIGYAYTQ